MNGFIRRGTCPIIQPSAVATRRTAIPLTSNSITAESTQGAERTGNTFSFHRKSWNGSWTIPMAETISARPRLTAPTSIACSVSHWEVPREIHIGEWQDTVPASFLCAVLRTNWRRLSAGCQHAALLLRCRLLRQSPRQHRRASESGEGVVNSSQRMREERTSRKVMKFIFVNHRTPLGPSSCFACSRSLGPGYLRDLSTQRPYCDHDCYARHQTVSLFMPWLAVTRTDPWPARRYSTPLELTTSFVAASWWCSISLIATGLRLGELMASEEAETARARPSD
jgi:hypothetical protein